MKFFKALFGSKEEKPEEKKKAEEAKNFDVLKYDGAQCTHAGQAEFAIRCFTHALQMQDDLEIHDYLSQAYIRTGELTLAYEQLQKLAEAQPDNQQIFIRMANVAYMMEDYGAMAGACEKAMLIDDKTAEVMYLYARACIGQEDVTNAVAMLTKAISLKEDYGDAYLLRGETLLKNGDTDEADEDATWLIEHTEDNEDVMMLKARIERAKGNTDAAKDYYTKVTDANPFNIDAYRERGELRLATGDEKGGNEDIEHAKELTAQLPENNDEEGIENKVKEKYKSMDPYGVF